MAGTPQNSQEPEELLKTAISNLIASEASPNPINDKWLNLCYRLFENVLDTSEFPFFFSFPQLISQLSFLTAMCPEKTTGLRSEFGLDPSSGEFAKQIQHNNFLENSQKFIKAWRSELKESSRPGKMLCARRASAYPTFAVSFHYNTLECLRNYQVELKTFDGAEEHRQWIARKLEGSYEKQEVIKIWDEEVVAEVVEKVPGARKKTLEEERKEETDQIDRAAPILMWISNANVALSPEIFDGTRMYTHGEIDYLRIMGTPKARIRVVEGANPWNMIVLPTVSPDLLFVLIYNFSRSLGPLEELRRAIHQEDTCPPCVVRKLGVIHEADKQNVYFPAWKEQDFYPYNFADELRKTVDMDDLFSSGGYGDLAHTKVKPSSGSVDPPQIGHLQQFSMISFFNAPSTRSKNDLPHYLDAKAIFNEVVTHPFVPILWDCTRKVPAFIGKITGKKIVETVEPVKEGFFKRMMKKAGF